MFALALLFFALTAGFTSAQNSNCDFVQNVSPNQLYDIRSPNYPANYPRNIVCRWIMICPTGYNCVLECPIVNLPESPSCSGDRMLVSRTGDPQLNGASTVCGKYPFTVASTAERLSLGLITTSTSPGGNFTCRLYAQVATAQPTCSCGERKQNRIVGGQETGVNEFRMMAALITRDSNQVMCGGTIITNRYIATAAHCIVQDIASKRLVLVGDHKLSTETETSATRIYSIQGSYVHPQYNSTNYDKDIAVVLTATVIQFNDAVGPVCLPFKYVNVNLAGALLTIIGWGTIFPGGPTSDTLQKVEVSVISQDTCRRYEPKVTPSQICTLTPGKDACQFDSGGPLLLTDSTTGLWFWIGTVSSGRFCASNSPGINTRVTEVLDWIVYVTGANFCRK